MQGNIRKNASLAAALLTAMLFVGSQSHAQSESPASVGLNGAQCKVLLQALQADLQASETKSLTPAQAQLLAQCLAAQGQAGTTPALTAAQSQVLLQGISGQSQVVATPSAGLSVPQNTTQPMGVLGQASLGPKKSGVVRIGVVQPKAQMGAGTAGANVGEALRTMIIQYLTGPTQEITPIGAMIPSQIDAEVAAKQCDYVLFSAISQKVGGGGFGMLKKMAPMASMVPGVGMIAGATGAMTAAAAGTVMSGAAGAVSTVKAKSEVTFDYRLMAPGNDKPIVADTEEVKAKDDQQDVFTPMIEQAATAILAEVTKRK